jgi:hypothetical protein
MSILDKFTAQRVDGFRRGLVAKVETQPCEATAPTMTHMFADKYVLTATLGVEFWANTSQFQSAKKTAERIALQGIYADILPRLDMLRSALYGHDIEEAMSLIGEMRRVCEGVKP